MSVISGLENVPDDLARTAVSIGIFDGVHLGHRSLLAALKSEAERIGGPAVVLTFDRHPMEILAPERAPLYINTLDQKLRLLEEAGADTVVVARFDHEIADISPEEFVEEILVGRLKAAAVVVGSNFRFGHKRMGDVGRLRTLGEAHGIRVVSVEPAIIHGGPVSSTRVRNAIARGDVEVAAQLLGYPFTMLGRVVKGQGIGHKLGFPTANIDVAPRQIVPKDGVYAARAIFDGSNLPGVCNIGMRPTLDGHTRTIEIYIDGFEGNIYEVDLATAFHSRLRDEVRFESLESLTEQIARDVEAARELYVDI